MGINDAYLRRVRDSAKAKILFLPHALRQMNRPERMIRASEIQDVIERGEIIEDYPEDTRGHSCLMLGRGESQRPIHVVCTSKEDYLAVIPAFLPDELEWTDGLTVRKSK